MNKEGQDMKSVFPSRTTNGSLRAGTLMSDANYDYLKASSSPISASPPIVS